MALIQRTRIYSSLPLFDDSELRLAVTTWADALASIPDAQLVPAWKRATETHDWSKPFAIPLIVKAYDQLVVEDRDRIERERFTQSRRNPGTCACRYCLDLGYALIDIWCAGTASWRRVRIDCECDLTPMMQRRPSPITNDWRFDHDSTAWIPPDAASAPTCTCLFCKNRR